MDGNVIGLSDGLGTTLETQYRYEPYGKTRVLGQASRNTQQYTGRENDATGLYYYRARYYDPETGRFVSPDPIGWAAGQTNGYAYVGGDPFNRTDPFGLSGNVPGRGSYAAGTGTLPGHGYIGAVGDFLGKYRDMREANTIGADKYFHCKANCEATQRGKQGEKMVCWISNGREWFDQKIKGDPASASAADQAANQYGRSQGGSSSQSCSQLCSPFRPSGLADNY